MNTPLFHPNPHKTRKPRPVERCVRPPCSVDTNLAYNCICYLSCKLSRLNSLD
jgi:hypothetical protein